MTDLPLDHLRQLCEARLQTLGLPDAFDLNTVRAELARRRGRPIQLMPVPTGLGPHGLWAETDTADYIAYECETTPVHQRHIIAHELAHITCGHQSGLDFDDLIRLLLPNVRPEVVRSVLGRSAFSTEEEREAELLASLMLERSPALEPLSISEVAVARFEALLSGRSLARR